MGVVTPNGDMYLISVNIDASQAHQLYFTTKLDQETFFQSKAVAGVSPADYTFIQKDDMIRVRKNADLLYNANYLMYRNTAHANRWFFAFIKEIKWLSDDSSAISFETDVYQTWRWDVSFKQSLVERETTPTDDQGDYLLDEGLDYGEYVLKNPVVADLGTLCILVTTTVKRVLPGVVDMPWAYKKTIFDGDIYNNIYSGAGMLYFENNEAGRTSLNYYLSDITKAGASDAIVTIYMCPKKGITTESVTWNDPNDGDPRSYKRVVGSSAEGLIQTIKNGAVGGGVEFSNRPTEIQTYYPLNKKLLSWPYCLVYAHNGNGSSAAYDIDKFINGKPTFTIFGSIQAMPQYKLVPNGYGGTTGKNVDEGITLANFPQCSYPIDGYKAWLAQSGASTLIGVAGGVGAAAASVALVAGAPAAAGVGTVMAISSVTNATQSMGKFAEASLNPMHAQGNANSGSVNSVFSGNDFYVAYKTIRKEWAIILDSYFTQFGYKVNRLKVPSFGCRQMFYYCKLINPNITGPIPSPDMAKLKNMFANGVTLWNNDSDIGVYPSPTNGITNNPVV